MRSLSHLACWSLLLLAAVELGAHARIRTAVPTPQDWHQAASFLKSKLGPRDLVVAAPDWADPILRQVAGERMDFAMVGRSDTSPFERLWALSIRGAIPPEAPPRPAEMTRDFGAVRLLRWELGPSPVRYDFVSHVRDARVQLGSLDCPLGNLAAPRGGGLGRGVLFPRQRFQCPGGKPWIFVAPVVMEDLELRPRHCLWQHPAQGDLVSTTFDAVPSGDRIVFYGGLYYEDERMRERGPVSARIHIDDKPVGELVHRDGDGWKRLEIDTRGRTGPMRVRVEVSAAEPHKRSFCWAASVRSGPEGVRQ